MIGDNDDKVGTDLDESEDGVGEDTAPPEDAMPDIGGDTVIDVSGELEALVENLDEEDSGEAAHKREVRKRLEELEERKGSDLDSTYNFDLDEDI